MPRYPALGVECMGPLSGRVEVWRSPWKCRNEVVGESVSRAVVIGIRSQPGDPSMKPVVSPPSDPNGVDQLYKVKPILK